MRFLERLAPYVFAAALGWVIASFMLSAWVEQPMERIAKILFE